MNPPAPLDSSRTYRCDGIDVRFPFEAYPSQVQLMEKVISTLNLSLNRYTSEGSGHCHALLESPTGTGKTLAMLCSVSAWLLAHRHRSDSTPRKIFYAMRTHSQIKEVVSEFRNLNQNRLTMSILGSRSRYCNNPAARYTPDVDETCRSLTQNKESPSCLFYENAKEIPNAPGIYSLTFAHDIEEFVDFGTLVEGCSYFAMWEMSKTSDVIFCPYFYIINPVMRANLKRDLKEAIIIIDEAHNLEGVARDAGSFELEENTLNHLLTDVNNRMLAKPETFQSLQILLKGLSDFIKAKKLLDNLPITFSGEDAKQVLVPYNITGSLLEGARKGIRTSKQESVLDNLSSKFVSKLEELVASLEYFFKSDGIHMEDYVLCLQGKTGEYSSRMKHTLSLWCMNPSVVFKDVAELSLSVILTSGTLSPMDAFSSELGIQFDTVFVAPHVIDVARQVWAGAIVNGPDNQRLEATYKNAQLIPFQDAIGKALEEICTIVPRGSIVFFPSFDLMDKLCARWKRTERWDQLKPRGATSNRLDDILKEYYGVLSRDSTNKATFLAVCRGKVSEGINLKDDRARAVIIVGVPMLNWLDVKIEQKIKYNDRYVSRGLCGGHAWYLQQSFRAVNQAAGRCIRHRFDYGAIVLLDARYDEERSRMFTSEWLKRSITKYTDFQRSLSDLACFFQIAEIYKELLEAAYDWSSQ